MSCWQSKYSLATLVLCLGMSPMVKAQVSGYNLLEYQYGNIPFNGPSDYSTAYNLTQLKYSAQGLDLGFRYEQFLTPVADREFAGLTQRSLRYQKDGFEVKVGQFYDIIGRGLLLRSYEIPGAIFEDLSYRSRYGFYRDLDGFSLGYTTDKVEVKFLRGRPLLNVFPPDEDRSLTRPDLVEGGQVSFSPVSNHTIGLTGLIHRPNDTTRTEYAGIFYSGTISDHLSMYGEFASENNNDARFMRDSDEQWAGYISLNYSGIGYGLSVEYKNYNRFILGSGFNDPPALIKEHSYPVLNRQTHILFANGESGWQLEGFKLWENFSQTVVNVTTLQTFNGLEASYFELFFEHTQEFDSFTLKAFYDYAHDEPKFQRQRHSGGLATDFSFLNGFNASIDFQAQRFESRSFDEIFSNYFLSLTLAKQGWFSASILGEMTSDWIFTDDPATFDIETNNRFWLGAQINATIAQSHRLSLFAGQRRGGPACTSGICYEVQDFSGAELRYTVNF